MENIELAASWTVRERPGTYEAEFAAAYLKVSKDLTRLRAELEDMTRRYDQLLTDSVYDEKRQNEDRLDLQQKLAAAEAARDELWESLGAADRGFISTTKALTADRDTHKARADAAEALLREILLKPSDPRNARASTYIYVAGSEADWIARRDAFLASPGASGGGALPTLGVEIRQKMHGGRVEIAAPDFGGGEKKSDPPPGVHDYERLMRRIEAEQARGGECAHEWRAYVGSDVTASGFSCVKCGAFDDAQPAPSSPEGGGA